MNTIDGKTINLNEVIICNKVREKNEDRIAILLRHEDETLEVARVIFDEQTLEEIIKGMKQIVKMELITGEKIKVLYEDNTEEQFPVSRTQLLRDIQEKQNLIKSSKIIENNWNDLSAEQKEEKKSQNKNRKKNALISAIVAGAITLGAGATALGCSINKKDDNNNNEYETYQNMTESEKNESTSHSTISIRDGVEYAFNVNNPKVISQMGTKLYNEVKDKNVLLLTSGEFINWDETIATEIVEKLNGLTPAIFKTMDEDSAIKENERINQSINLLIAAYQNVENKDNNLVNMADYVSSDIDRAIMNNASVLSRRVDLETVGEPVSGEIIDSEEEFNKLSQPYINSMDRYLHYIKDTLEESDFIKMEPSTRRIVLEIFSAGCTNIPLWFKITDLSEKEQRVADFPLIYYRDNTLENSGEWFPMDGKVDQFGQPYFYRYDNGKITKDVKSLEEMVHYYEATKEVRKQGLLGTIDDAIEEAKLDEDLDLYRHEGPNKQNNY